MRIRSETLVLLSAIAAEETAATAADVCAALGMTGGSMRARLIRFSELGWLCRSSVIEPRKGITGRKDIAHFTITPAGRALLQERGAMDAYKRRPQKEQSVVGRAQFTRIPNSVFALASSL